MKKSVNISTRLKELRGSKSQKEFAAEIGVAFRSYQRYESGERLPPSFIIGKIAQFCNVSADWIITGKSNDSPDKIKDNFSNAQKRAKLIMKMVDMLIDKPEDTEEIIQALIDEMLAKELRQVSLPKEKKRIRKKKEPDI